VSACEGDGVTGHEHHRIPAAGGGTLDVRTVEPEGGSSRWAILVHGGPGGGQDGPAGLFAELARRLAATGVATLRYDSRGSGASSGRWREVTLSGLVADLNSAAAWLRAGCQVDRLAIVGESLGGTTALMRTGEIGDDVDALVLLYPAIWLLDGVIEEWVSPDARAEAKSTGCIVRDDAEVGTPFLQELLELGDVAKTLPGLLTPTLFVHGDQDTEVPAWQSARAQRLVAGPVRHVVVRGGGHGLEQRAEQEIVYAETAHWLAEHLR
jgi:hypothetical protein